MVMKIITILSHPFVQVFSFLIIMISGESFGGPYGMYLFFAVKEGYLYAIVGIAALVITLVSLAFRHNAKIKPGLRITGTVGMVLSLFIFFKTGTGYNNGTFHQAVPLLTILLFILVIIAVFMDNVVAEPPPTE